MPLLEGYSRRAKDFIKLCVSKFRNLKAIKFTFPRSTVNDYCKLHSWELRITFERCHRTLMKAHSALLNNVMER